MKWLDSRIYGPNSNSSDYYTVIFQHDCSKEMLCIGRAAWVPFNNYTEGRWENISYTNGNKVSESQVLFWLKNPKLPEWLRNAK